MNCDDYLYRNNIFNINSETDKNDDLSNKYKEAFFIDNRSDKSTFVNKEDFSDKKIDHIETKSNSHSFINSIPKSEIHFNIDEGNLKNTNFQYSLGKLANEIVLNVFNISFLFFL